MKDGPCGYCSGVRLVGWSGAGPILCPRCCDRDEDVFSVVTQAWREQRTRVVELEAELAVLRAELAAAREAVTCLQAAFDELHGAAKEVTEVARLRDEFNPPDDGRLWVSRWQNALCDLKGASDV